MTNDVKGRLTIIIPFYCTPKDLFKRCIESILVDNVLNIEVVVVDDGSSYEYHELLESFSKDVRYRVIYNEHSGVSAARNRGIKEATGSWISFVDSDDFIDSCTLTRILENIDRFSGDIEIFHGGIVRDGQTMENSTFLQPEVNYVAKEESVIELMESALSIGKVPGGYKQWISLGSPCSKLFRKNFIEEHDLYFDEAVSFAEDCLFMMGAYKVAGGIYYHDWYLYNYVSNSQSVTRRFRPGVSKEKDVFFSKVNELISKFDLTERLNKAYLIRAHFEVGRSITTEFFNAQNHDKNARRKYKEFISKEPYRTALRNDTLFGNSTKEKCVHFLIKHGWGRTYSFLKKIQSKRG